jgi:hypothetical protein
MSNRSLITLAKLRVPYLFALAVFGVFSHVQAQQPYSIQKTDHLVLLDGKLNESCWQKAQHADSFRQHFPTDTTNSISRTEFMLSYDDRALYAAFICYNRNPQKDFVVQSLKRDFSILNNDAIVLTLSPFLDGQNGFSFGVTPMNAQREGVVENGGNFGVTTAWDQIWYSATRVAGDTWFAEFEIPFKSIRFAEGNLEWAMNVVRADYKNNEVSSWVTIPRVFNLSQLSFTQKLIWPESPKRKGKNIALIPYASNLSFGKAPYNQAFQSNKPRFGTDAKLGITSALNLDITMNPDFAQVDVDVQQINLTRYSLFFPERRQFFIENSDLFANFGFRQIRPFFSRRIGLGATGNIPIDAGARLTGKIGNNWRVGAMAVQTRDSGSLEPGSKNFLIGALQRKVFQASNVGFILVHDMNGSRDNFGKAGRTVSGLEYNLQSRKNDWVGKAFIQKAFGNGVGPESWSHATFLLYQTVKWSAMWNHEYVGKDFRARSGFVPRIENYDPVINKIVYLTYWRLEPQIKRIFYPKNTWINRYSLALYNSSYYDSVGNPTESRSTGSTNILLQNSAELRATIAHNYYNIYVPFIPVRSSGYYLLGVYQWFDASVGFTSNNRKKVNGVVDVIFGNFYNGRRTSLSSSLQYRKQPWGVFSVNYQRENIELYTFGKSNFDLIGVKAEISFSTTMYFTAFMQYNTQADNVNMNFRYQWRYSPLSDFFIVYSENYRPDFQSKDRSLALKLVYWFNT